ncbi:hypothetical protein [Thiomicrorhabdus immobilis]|uniref:hypothetical protein n=1 Tax=Thiomicrorhabdus immobilis TaxID=2791037 RepID=UPI001F2027EA|nr:hypothetical protein [Thiomicrorhabdus immobilis]
MKNRMNLKYMRNIVTQTWMKKAIYLAKILRVIANRFSIDCRFNYWCICRGGLHYRIDQAWLVSSRWFLCSA